MVDCVIVVPKQSGILLVGVVIVLEFSRGCHIFCPAVKGRPGVRSVQMDRVGEGGVVDESDHTLRSTRNHKSRAWRHAIVSDQICNTQIGVDRLGEWLDLHFEVLNILSCDRIGQDSKRPRIVSIDAIVCWRSAEVTYFVGCLIGGIGKGTL